MPGWFQCFSTWSWSRLSIMTFLKFSLNRHKISQPFQEFVSICLEIFILISIFLDCYDPQAYYFISCFFHLLKQDWIDDREALRRVVPMCLNMVSVKTLNCNTFKNKSNPPINFFTFSKTCLNVLRNIDLDWSQLSRHPRLKMHAFRKLQRQYARIHAQSFSNYFEGVRGVEKKSGGSLFYVLLNVHDQALWIFQGGTSNPSPRPLCARCT